LLAEKETEGRVELNMNTDVQLTNSQLCPPFFDVGLQSNINLEEVAV
jgi:hypothetical protein